MPIIREVKHVLENKFEKNASDNNVGLDPQRQNTKNFIDETSVVYQRVAFTPCLSIQLALTIVYDTRMDVCNSKIQSSREMM